MRKHSKDYFHLFYSQLFANTGDILTIVGLIAIVFNITSKTTACLDDSHYLYIWHFCE